METTRYLYKKAFSVQEDGFSNDFLSACTVRILRPSPRKLCLPTEKLSPKQWLGRLYFWLISGGKYEIWFLYSGEQFVHFSYVVPKCAKFPFLEKSDYEIGPCATSSDYPRRGAYRYVLDKITAHKAYAGACFYMIVKSTNLPSIGGIEKAGFTRCGNVKRTPIFKNYVQEKQ